MKLSREEILQLHTLTEEEQKRWLKNNSVLQRRKHPSDLDIVMEWESLADCAFRLRDEVRNGVFLEKATEVFQIYTEKEDLCGAAKYWMLSDAEPIYWIQAALLAKDSK